MRFSLNKEDIIKILKGAVIAGAGAAGVYGLEMIPSLNFGIWAPVVGAGCSVLANILRKWIADNSKK